MKTIPLYENYPELNPIKDQIELAVQLIVDCHKNNGLVLLCGNGGSAADCSHIVGELMKEFRENRQGYNEFDSNLVDGVAAIDLTANKSLITAMANDVDPDKVFSQQVYVYSKHNPFNLLIGLSTSGNSENVVQAFEIANKMGLQTIALTGENDSRLSELGYCVIQAPAHETYRVQEYHLAIYHYICSEVERELFD